MHPKALILTLTATLLTAAAACGDEDEMTSFVVANSTSLTFMTHVDASLIEQDVFIMHSASDETVVRVTADDLDPATLAAPIYASNAVIPHDPFGLGPNPMGPFGRGADLGMTLGEWLSASGRRDLRTIRRRPGPDER